MPRKSYRFLRCIYSHSFAVFSLKIKLQTPKNTFIIHPFFYLSIEKTTVFVYFLLYKGRVGIQSHTPYFYFFFDPFVSDTALRFRISVWISLYMAATIGTAKSIPNTPINPPPIVIAPNTQIPGSPMELPTTFG